MTDYKQLCAELIAIEDALSSGNVQFSNQGQALDGYSALAAFRDVAARARAALAQPLLVKNTNQAMPITTIKRCQSDRDWWYTVEDCNVECDPESGTGLTITYFDEQQTKGRQLLAVNQEDALLLRDAINQLYPPA